MLQMALQSSLALASIATVASIEDVYAILNSLLDASSCDFGEDTPNDEQLTRLLRVAHLMVKACS